MCSSGDSTAQGAEQTSANFQNTLAQSYAQQYGQNQAVTQFLTGNLQSQITNPQGYDPATLASMRTGATDTIATQYQNAQKALNNQQMMNGSESLPSGVNEMQQGALKQGQATDTATAQENITQQDANLKNQNYWNAVSALNGVNANNSANNTAAATNGAGSTTASLSNANTYANATAMSPYNALIGAAGGAGAAALYGKMSQ